jgi:uncharacterized protein
MSDGLPQRIDPYRLAEQRRELRGTMSLADMRRIAPLLSSAAGEVQVEMRFGIDERRVHYVRGHVSAALEMTCQRCLGRIGVPVEADFALGVVRSEAEGERLGEEYEALVAAQGPLALADVVEDELILALPVVALHETECAPQAEAPAPVPAELERRSPFEALRELKKK